uniref:Uncharacterized protein n=1 Tax=Trichobilharzia regenti TaxID=157069 RepID=A0AA85KCV1_TRIRE|nr:unnamed protein product [Trichobilharzia regenti]
MQSDHGSTSRYSTHILLSTHYQLPLKSLVTHSASVLVAVTHASLSRLHSFSPACRTAANNYLRVHFILSNSLPGVYDPSAVLNINQFIHGCRRLETTSEVITTKILTKLRNNNKTRKQQVNTMNPKYTN